ncbi:hypothetical protein D3C84_955990 [compost metagenome]
MVVQSRIATLPDPFRHALLVIQILNAAVLQHLMSTMHHASGVGWQLKCQGFFLVDGLFNQSRPGLREQQPRPQICLRSPISQSVSDDERRPADFRLLPACAAMAQMDMA